MTKALELWQWIREYSMIPKNRYNPNKNLAKELQISCPHLSHLVNYRTPPSLELALRIQDISGGKVDAYDLIDRTIKKKVKK